MKKLFTVLICVMLGVSAVAQQKIQLRSADRAECTKSDMTSLKASFSFSTVDAEDVITKDGDYSWLSMPNTVLGGNEGEPQIPVVNQLIAVPVGAEPTITVTSYSTKEYNLTQMGIKTLIPRQPSVRKDKNPDEVPFVKNEAAYQSTRGFRSEPKAVVSVEGTMRGVRLGKMTIEPVSYDPVNNTLRVFNDIEVEVSFNGADAKATEDLLVETYSPYFDIVYKQLFNNRAVMDAYTDHPDLYKTPVKMLVVATSTYTSTTAFQNWLNWKRQKGIDVDIYTVTSSTASSTIRSEIQNRYNTNHPTFLVIVGDETVVKAYKTNWSCDSTYGNCINDMEYASVDNDVYHDMYMSRMSVSSTTELGNLINKILTYEKYTMSDPSYLNNSLLVAGWDDYWTNQVGKPTIQYANNNYYNSAHGITPTVYITTASGQTAAWNNINNVGFINYTAHGDIQELSDPVFSNTNASNLTNNGKYFWLVANCCLSANWGNNTYKPCLGETLIRAANKGAFGYIGSIPETLWYEDYYFGVGAFNFKTGGAVQTVSGTSVGMYDAAFDETGFNCLNAMPYIGNVAVTYAHAKGYSSSVDDEYYWRAYQTLGDGSVMPYLKVPAANNVSHNSTIPAGSSTFRVNADAGSYVSITVNNNIIGVAAVPANATYVDVPFTTTPVAGQTAMIVVTRNQRQPYINNNVGIVGGVEYTITANVSPANSGTINGAGTYYENAECTLTATANHGYAFDHWALNNAVASTDPEYTFTVTGDASYTANFHQLTPHHTTYIPEQTNGTISVDITNAYAGDIITLTATPNPGFCLDEWFVYTVSKERIPVVNNQFTMPDADVTISATFKSGYTVTVASVANGTITATPTTAMPGDIITLTATPNTGCELVTWYVYKTGDQNTTVAVVNNGFTMPSYDVTVSAVFATTSNATVTIGSGTSNNQYLPTYSYYNYSLTQQIYTAAELGEAGTITTIAFQVANSKSATRTVDIYMRPTNKTSFTSNTDWETMGTVYKVFSGSVTFNASGWTTITLDTPYKHDGAKNLNLCVVDGTGSYVSGSSNSPTFLVYSTGANRAMRVYNDDNAYTSVSYSSITDYTGSYVTSNNQIKITKILSNAESLTVTPTELNGFSYIAGQGPSEVKSVDVVGTDLNNDITVTAPTGFEVSASAAGTYSNSLTIPRTTTKGGRALTSWDFEGDFLNWTTIDKDGDGYNWMVSTELMGTTSALGHNSSDGLTSQSYENPSSKGDNGIKVTNNGKAALTPDNWLVSPQVTLGGTFSMWAEAQDDAWFEEHFAILVSTTSNTNTNSFTMLNEWTLEDGDWHQYSVDLSAYTGQTGYIAVRHYNCTDMFYINVDDFQLDTEAAIQQEFPVALTTATVYVRMKDNLDPDEYNGNMTVSSGSLSKTVSLNGEVLPGSGEQYTITVNAEPTEGGTVAGGGTFYEGSHHNLTATPNEHYTFTGWRLNGDIVSTNNPYNIEVTGDATYTAVFTEDEEYTVTITQVEGGIITADLDTAYPGDVVTLSVTTQNGHFFESWIVTDANNQTVTVTNDQFTMPASDVTVTALFTQGFEVILNQTDHGTISADQTTALAPGTVVNLTATPDNGCVLLAWYVYKTGNPRDVISVVNDEWFFMPSNNVTVQAIFVTEEEHEAQLGSGTNTNQYIPTYVRANYSLTQQIYTASELGNQNGRITKIAYYGYGSNNTAAATRNLTIYIAHTDKSTFSSGTDWEVMGSVAKVFEGNVTFNRNAWATITLNAPFEYDGTSNINVCVVDNTGSQSGSNQRYIQFYRYNGTNRAIYANGSSSYANIVGYSDQLSNTSGTRISYVNRINITMMVPGSAESLTISPGEMNDFSYVEGHGPSNTHKLDIVGVDLSNNITINAPTNFEVSMTEDGTYTSSVTVPRETGSKGNRDIQTWDFEDGLQGWTVADADGDGYNWTHSTSYAGHDASTGVVYSQSYDNSAGVLTPDNWLISPQVELGGSFSMWTSPLQAAYPNEHFGIYVSTTGTAPSSFIMLSEWTMANTTWKQYSVDLSAFVGQQGHIAIRHFNCSDVFVMLADDFVLDTDAAITVEMPVTITPATVYVRLKDNLNPNTYTGTLTGSAGTGDNLNGSVSLSGEVIAEFDITVAASPAEGGTVRGAGAYADGTSVTVRAAANEGYAFVNWTEDDVEVSTDAEYTFTVTADRDLVANFELATAEQEITLVQGYNWFTPAVEISLADLETALGENGVSIMTKDESVTYYAGYGWWGDDIVIVPGQMYKIQTNTTCSITLSGQPAEITDHAVTLNRGYNWIGYFGTQNTSLVSALINLQPEDGDVIMDKDLSATYYAGYGWWGDLETLVPGKGYLYKSNANETKTFYFPSSSK